MKILLSNMLLFCLLQGALGQVSGKLVSAGGQPIPFANVLLLQSADTVLVKAALTDEKGAYQFENIAQGKYILRFSSIGYQTWDSPQFELTDSLQSKDFGSQVMKEEAKQLGEVIVRAEKPLFQQQMYGTTVNVEGSVLTKGSSVLEVLERSPGVVIDRRNNNIALNGKSGVVVMINGKLMRMPMEQVIALLNGMNADNIEKIELLTTPPSRYDAEGSAGMINIVLKKNKKQGTNGSLSVTGGYGWGEKGSGSLNLAHNTKKIGLYGSYAFSHNRNYTDVFIESSQNFAVLGGQMDVLFWNTTKPVQNSHDAIIGLEAKLNPTFTIGSSVNYNSSSTTNSIFNHASYNVLPDSLLLFTGNIKERNRWKNLVTSVYAEKKIREGEQINVDLDYFYYKNDSPTEVLSTFLDKNGNEAGTNNDSLFSPRQKGQANTSIRVGVVKMDYIKQLSKKIKFETGVKGAYTRSSSFSGIESWVNGGWVSRSETANAIVMKEGIGAGYASVNAQINASVALVIGARYEYSHTRMDNAKTGENTVDRKLGRLFPNLFFSIKLNDDADLQLSYTKRIRRPSYNDLASFIAYSDPVAVFTGNPFLKPTITNNVKLGYNYRGYSFSILLSRDDDPIVQTQLTKSPSGDLMYVSPQNLTYRNSLTFQTNLPWKVNDWWSMNYGFVGGWRQFKEDYTIKPVKETYFGYSASFSESFKLPRNFFVEVSGWYNSLSYEGTLKINGYGAVNAGIKKELKNNKGTFQLSVSDLFRSLKINTYFGYLTEEAFSVKSRVTINTESRKMPIIKLTYSRSFGNTGNKDQKKQGTGSQEEKERIKRN